MAIRETNEHIICNVKSLERRRAAQQGEKLCITISLIASIGMPVGPGSSLLLQATPVHWNKKPIWIINIAIDCDYSGRECSSFSSFSHGSIFADNVSEITYNLRWLTMTYVHFSGRFPWILFSSCIMCLCMSACACVYPGMCVHILHIWSPALSVFKPVVLVHRHWHQTQCGD